MVSRFFNVRNFLLALLWMNKPPLIPIEPNPTSVVSDLNLDFTPLPSLPSSLPPSHAFIPIAAVLNARSMSSQYNGECLQCSPNAVPVLSENGEKTVLAGFALTVAGVLAADYYKDKDKKKTKRNAPEAAPSIYRNKQTAPKPKNPKKMVKSQIAIPRRPSELPNDHAGKVKVGKTFSGTKRQREMTGRNTNAFLERALLHDAKPKAEVKRERLPVERKTTEKETQSSPPTIKIYNARVKDHKHFAFVNAVQFASLNKARLITANETDEKREECKRHLASLYYLNRFHINILKYEMENKSSIRYSKNDTRNLTVHQSVNTTIAEFKLSLENFRTSIPSQLAALKDQAEKPAFNPLEIGRIFSAFGFSGPHPLSEQKLAEEMGFAKVSLPELKSTPLHVAMEKHKINEEHLKISDDAYLQWALVRIIPLINLLAAPLLIPNVQIRPMHAIDIAAIKQLLTFLGEFYSHDRNIPHAALFQECRERLRNSVAHHVLVEKRGDERREIDTPDYVVLTLCRQLSTLNPARAELADFDDNFSYSPQVFQKKLHMLAVARAEEKRELVNAPHPIHTEEKRLGKGEASRIATLFRPVSSSAIQPAFCPSVSVIRSRL